MTRNGVLAVGVALAVSTAAFAQPPGPALAALPSSPAPLGEPSAPLFEGYPPAEDAPRVWGNAAYILGWVRGDLLPPLVTTSPAGTPSMAAGVLGNLGNSVLIGGGRIDTGTRSGARADFGYSFDPADGLSVEAGFFVLGSGSASAFASSDGSVILARPFTDVTTGLPNSSLVAFPGVSSGSVLVADSGRDFFGYNADLSQSCPLGTWGRVDALLGYQYLRYDERLNVGESVNTISGPFAAGTNILSEDGFSTRNIFNGVDLGLRGEMWYGPLSVEVLGKVAAGSVNRTVGISGTQTVTVPGSAPVVSPGGLLALSSNIGPYNSRTFTAIPQVGVNLGWQFNPNIRLFTGYSALWWPNVARPGDQVDLDINPGLIPGGAGAAGSPERPTFTGVTSTVWVQTVSFGLEVKY